MLRNRSSRAMTTKQTLMADHGSQSSPTQNYKRSVQSFLGSPTFKAFTKKVLADAEIAEISPTSILETLSFSPFGNPFWDDINPPKSPKILAEHKHSWERLDSKGIGLALIDLLTDKTIEENSSSKPNNKVVFGSKLRVQIPPLPSSNLSPDQSLKSPTDFGIKTGNSQLSSSGSANSAGIQTKDPPKVCTECLSASEIELSEDYTCVISHGPNPKTTRIFDNCIIESYCSLSDKSNNSAPENFLSFCYTCKKNLEQKNDIYIYRFGSFSPSEMQLL